MTCEVCRDEPATRRASFPRSPAAGSSYSVGENCRARVWGLDSVVDVPLVAAG